MAQQTAKGSGDFRVELLGSRAVTLARKRDEVLAYIDERADGAPYGLVEWDRSDSRCRKGRTCVRNGDLGKAVQ